LTPATDWFSFGVVLYELLTHRSPRSRDWLYAYAWHGEYPAVPRPSDSRPDIPADLDELCVALLDRDPARRPAAAEVLRALTQGWDAEDLRRRAAGEQLRSDFKDDALATMAPLAKRAGLRLHGGALDAIGRVAHLSLRMRVRGLGWICGGCADRRR